MWAFTGACPVRIADDPTNYRRSNLPAALDVVLGVPPFTRRNLDNASDYYDLGYDREKPQSKVWFNGHTWWAVLPTNAVAPTGTWLSGSNPITLDSRPSGDVAERQGRRQSHRQRHARARRGDPHRLNWSLSSTSRRPIPISCGRCGRRRRRSTSARPARLTWTQRVVCGLQRTAPRSSRSTTAIPLLVFHGTTFLATDTSGGQITSVVALPNNTIGVFWTNFAQQRFGFRAHVDGTDPTMWLADEAPGLAYHPNQNMADDHVNLAVASDGTLYAAVKAGHASCSVPLMYLLVRHPGSGGSGTWDDIYTVGNSGTRPTLVLNEDTQKLQVFFSRPAGSTSMNRRNGRSASVPASSRCLAH